MTVRRPKNRPQAPSCARRVLARDQIELVRNHSHVEDDTEEALLAFDPDEALDAVIAMPPTIPTQLREMITATVCARFEWPEDLDAWLNTPSIVLGGATPFERLALGDGTAVLLALGIAAPTTTMLASRRDLTKRIEAAQASHLRRS